jgi:hypothetical protein
MQDKPAFPYKLLTFPKEKYAEQIVAIQGPRGSLNIALFDAVKVFAEDDTMKARSAVAQEARLWAESFVAQFNAGHDALIAALKEADNIDQVQP